jgi:hypothetical protein
MKHKLYSIVVTALGLISTVVAQNPPPDLPYAPDQGPITGIGWLLAAGGLLFARKIRNQHKK